MRIAALLCLTALAGCQSEAERRADRYAVIDRNSVDDAQRCAAAREVARAYLMEANEPKFRQWDATVELVCSRAAA